MITSAQQAYVEDHAYVPEHVPHYVTAISQTEPFLFGDFLAYVRKSHLIFIGYPLKETFEEKRLRRALEDSIKRFNPESVSLTAPSIPPSVNDSVHPPSDHYYRLDLPALSIPQKLRNMLERGGRELSVGKRRDFDEEHRKIVDGFLIGHPLDEANRIIFERIGEYLVASTTAWVFDARDRRGELVAFDVAEFRPKDYALYMFNFRSKALHVPGASDLLLYEVIQQAKTEGKKFANLGLGINAGVSFFKKKWGGRVFLSHAVCFYSPSKKEDLETLLRKL